MLPYRRSPMSWAFRLVALLGALIAVMVFIGPYYLVRAHNLATEDRMDAIRAEVAKTTAENAKKEQETGVVIVPIFTPPDPK